MIARVAIDLALDRLFDYAVPEALEKKLAVGQLLSVPFGHREARGFAMELKAESEVGQIEGKRIQLKAISEIVDETPFFSRELLMLVKQIAGYTASPLESVLKAAVPAAVLKPNARPKEQIFVEPIFSSKNPELTSRLQWLYDQLVRLGGGWMQQLCEELKTTPKSIRELGTRGLVTIAPRARRRDPLKVGRILPSRPLLLNEEQQRALALIVSATGKNGSEGWRPVVLFGVTGSGKTEVYLQAIAKELEAGRGAIVMVPEISLTPQTVARFASRFGDKVAVLHSALSDGERYDEWHRIRSGQARVVVGPRSAVFAPVQKLGLIVVDEEHETSYKQEELPRYHARDVAVMRGRIEGAKVVLGSATPALETWANVLKGKYALAEMRQRAGAGSMPAIAIVDMKTACGDGSNGTAKGAIFSRDLLDAMKLRLNRGEQTILFLNRRGYSRSVTCSDCGYVMTCEKCDVPFTYHRADSCLRCHICGDWQATPTKCPACGSPSFSYLGVGTQRVEAAIKKCFPQAKVIRMDADSTSRKHSHDDLLGQFRRHEADILLGTQMIAKGLDFPNVTLVGVLNASSSLSMPDFRAGERTYQLISQVAGRAGRAELPGEVFIQALEPDAPVIRLAAAGDFAAFAEAELKSRKEWYYPPFCHLAVLNLRAKNPKLVADWAEMYAASFAKYFAKVGDGDRYLVGEAAPSALEKADGWHRWQIVLRAPSATVSAKAWKWLSSVRPAPQELRVSLDVDAHSFA